MDLCRPEAEGLRVAAGTANAEAAKRIGHRFCREPRLAMTCPHDICPRKATLRMRAVRAGGSRTGVLLAGRRTPCGRQGLKAWVPAQPAPQVSAAFRDDALQETFAGIQLIQCHEFIRAVRLANGTGAADDCRDARYFVK